MVLAARRLADARRVRGHEAPIDGDIGTTNLPSAYNLCSPYTASLLPSYCLGVEKVGRMVLFQLSFPPNGWARASPYGTSVDILV
jgi:hypothetical protein